MKVTEIYVYPVKALRGIRLPAADVGPQGLRHDRQFMLLTPKAAKGGAVVLERVQLGHHPRCALFSQALEGGDVVVRFHPPENAETEHHPPPLRIPLAPAIDGLAPLAVNLHGSVASRAYAMGAAYDAWFSACFGRPIVLAYIGDGQRPVLGTSLHPGRGGGVSRQALAAAAAVAVVAVAVTVAVALKTKANVQSSWTPMAVGLLLLIVLLLSLAVLRKHDDPWIAFSDCAPLLVTSEASRKAASAMVATAATTGDDDRPPDPPVDVPMYKFRPNLVVDGEAAWAEDFWAELAVQQQSCSGSSSSRRRVRLLLTGNCGRCASLNVDYATGAPAAGAPGTVLKRLMAARRVDAGNPYAPVFGRYAFLAGARAGTLAVGDDVAVVRRSRQRTTWDWPL